jgi:hypothetical protein
VSLPKRDVDQLVSALRDVLDALQDAAGAEADVRLTGRPSPRRQDAERRSDFDARS